MEAREDIRNKRKNVLEWGRIWKKFMVKKISIG